MVVLVSSRCTPLQCPTYCLNLLHAKSTGKYKTKYISHTSICFPCVNFSEFLGSCVLKRITPYSMWCNCASHLSLKGEAHRLFFIRSSLVDSVIYKFVQEPNLPTCKPVWTWRPTLWLSNIQLTRAAVAEIVVKLRCSSPRHKWLGLQISMSHSGAQVMIESMQTQCHVCSRQHKAAQGNRGNTVSSIVKRSIILTHSLFYSILRCRSHQFYSTADVLYKSLTCSLIGSWTWRRR